VFDNTTTYSTTQFLHDISGGCIYTEGSFVA